MDGDHKREVLLITISVFLFSLIVGLLGTVLPLYLRQENFTISEIGFSFAAASLLFATGNVALGAFSDYIGRKKFILIAIFAMVVGSFLIGLVPIFPIAIASVLVVIARILSSFSTGLFYNFTNIRMADLGKKERGFMYGLYMFASGAGVGIGMIFFSFLLRFLPFNDLFYIGSGLAFVSLLFFLLTKDFVQKQESLRFRDIFKIRLSKALKIMLASVFVLFFVIGMVDYFLIPLYLKDVLHVSDSLNVFILGISTLLYGILSAFAGKFVDKRNEFHVAYIALFLIAITSVLMGIFQTIILFSIIWLIDYFIWSFGDPARFKIGADLADREKGKIISIFGLVFALGQGAGFASAEKVVGLFGYSGMFYMRAFFVLISGLMILWAHKVLEHEHTRPH